MIICRRQGLPVLPCRACRTGTVAPGGGADRESRRRSERKPRQGRPDAAGARGAGSGMAGCRPGACGPRAIRAGRRTPARDHPAGPGSDRRPDAPERRGGAPARSRVGRGTGGCGCPVRRALSRHYAQRRERPGRTRALPPICMAKAARWRASRQHTDSAVLRVSPGQAGCLPSRPIRAFCGRIGPSVSQVCIASIKSAARVSTMPRPTAIPGPRDGAVRSPARLSGLAGHPMGVTSSIACSTGVPLA